ncbi:MAG: hypothetical protein LUD14_09965 [Clostridiales bacterium]|nr:hypothetical protein [Clostridiales bacterium]
MPSVRKTKPAPNILTVHAVLFFGFFLAGILLANFRFTDETFRMGYQMENACRILDTADRNWKSFIIWAIKNRLLLWMALCVLKRIFRNPLPLFGCNGWIALSLGFIFSSLTGQFSFAGILLCAAILFPQILLYLPACILLITTRITRKRPSVIHGLLITGIFLSGTLSEYFLNPWFLQKIYCLITLIS